MLKKIVSILFLLLAFAFAEAQNYPLQITAQLAPPFSGYIPDYAAPGEQKLKLLCLFTDFTEPVYDFKLKIVLQGQGISISSKSWYYAGPFTITPGMPMELSGADLAGLLNTAHLDFSGISVQDYNNRKVLPEGFYSICVTAYDFSNPVQIQVSNPACAFAWFTLADPPLLDLPFCGSTVNETSPQQITFQWTPMNMSDPSSMLNTEYEFSLYEIFPANADPNAVVQSLPPIYQVTTGFSTLNYGITEPLLVLGRHYAWRVRARDATGRDLFRNSGYSQVCTFIYGNIYGNPLDLTLHAQALTHRSAKLWWDSITTFTSYHLEYRKAGGNWNWFPVNTTNAHTRVSDLEPNTDYEARVNGTTNENYTGPWSNTVTFHTPVAPTINCGDAPVPIDPSTIHPLTVAAVGQIWQVGQFELIVTQLQNTSSINGVYSGLGKIVLPFGGINVRCAFTNVTVDENHIVVAGEVKALSDGIDSWLSQWESQFVYDDSYSASCDIDSIYVNSANQVVIVCSDGSTIIVPDDHDGGLLITDGDGDQWVVDGDGNVVPVNGGGALLPVTHDTLTAEELDILRTAMLRIKSEYDDNKVETLRSDKNTAAGSYSTFISNERQGFPAPTEQYEGEVLLVGVEDVDSLPANEGTQKGTTYKNAEVSYNTGKVLFVMSRNITTNEQLNFIGNYLTVNGKTFEVFVAESKSAGRSDNDIAADVAQLGLKHLAELVVAAKMR